MADADIKDFLTALSAADVKFVVVGAYAVASHGRLRATTDFDVLVEPTRDNANALAQAIREFSGASLEYFGVTVEELSRPRFGFYMGVEPDRTSSQRRSGGPLQRAEVRAGDARDVVRSSRRGRGARSP